MTSSKVKTILLVLVLAMASMFLVGCEDTSSTNGVTGAAKTFSGYVTKSQVKYAIKSIEDSGFGVSASAIGAELTTKYGSSKIGADGLYKAVKARCEKMGLGSDCSGK